MLRYVPKSSLLLRLIALAAFGILPGQSSTQADMVLSFAQPDYIANVGDVVSLDVYLTQVAGGPQVDATNPLISAGIRATYDPSIVFADIFFYNASFDDVQQVWSPGDWGLTMLSLSGIADFTSPVLLGRYDFIALTPGVTAVVLSDFDSQTPDFATELGDFVDPTNQFTARITVVPEPASFVLISIGGLAGLAYRRRMRNRSSIDA